MIDNAGLDALIVRNIGDLEAAIDRAQDQIEKRLWKETVAALRESVDDSNWYGHYNPDEHEVWIAHRNWLKSDADLPEPECSFSLDEVGDNGNETWIGTFTGAGFRGATLGLYFTQELLGKSDYKKFLQRETALVERLRSSGFRTNPQNSSIIYPITVDQALLADAFEQEDFSEALSPIANAFRAAMTAASDFDALMGAIRARTAS